MKAKVITIGDEILIGQIVDSNAAYIGQKLTAIGVDVVQIETVGDDFEAIVNAMREVPKDCELVLLTGGLGPTKDDLTKRCFCFYFDDQLEMDTEILEYIKTVFLSDKEPILQRVLDQALLPSGAIALKNRWGTAPGMWREKEGVVYVALPGVPYEMKGLLVKEVLPRLKQRLGDAYILQRTLLTYGIPESRIAQRIEEWEDSLPTNMKLAYLPQPGMVRLRIMARGENRAVLERALADRLKALEVVLGPIFKGYEKESNLQEEIADRLVKLQLSLATAESCTGGKIATLFTEIPGASAYFRGALVPYQTAVKTSVLKVPEALITNYSVVSREVAKAMARGAQKLFQADLAVATTGNAGPTKGDSEAEIGTVFIAIAFQQKVVVKEYHWGRPREKVVRKAVNQALVLLNDLLLQVPD